MFERDSSRTESSAIISRRHLNRSLVGLLLIQILLGVANALWLNVPSSGNAWSAAAPQVLLYGHVLVSGLLVLMAIGLMIVAARTRAGAWLVSSGIGLLGIVVSVGAGFGFMGSNGSDAASFTMAAGCIVALGSYTVALIRR